MRTAPFLDSDLTRDAFLDGRAQLLQPKDGYRAGIDPVLMAASIPLQPGQSLLDLGCGGGIGLVLAGTRVAGLDLCGLELQSGYADLARRNLTLNGLNGTVLQGSVSDPPNALRARSFDHVMANPPYFDRRQGFASDEAGREVGLGGDAPLADWITLAAKRLKPFGHVTVIQRVERVPELMSAMGHPLGSVELWPLAPRDGHPPRLVLVRARKDGRAPFRLHPALILHGSRDPAANGLNYTPAIEAVVRHGAALPFPE